jgi:hypothetical protein
MVEIELFRPHTPALNPILDELAILDWISLQFMGIVGNKHATTPVF